MSIVNASGRGKLGDVEIVSLDPGLPKCPKPADLPVPTSRMVAALINGTVTICGGESDTGKALDACYEYVNSTWNMAPFKLNEKRVAAAGVVLQNGTWLVLGGYSGVDDRTEVLVNGRFSVGNPIPSRLVYHCALSINGSHIFVGEDSVSFVVDVKKWNWVQVEGGAYFPNCGMVKNKKNGREIMMVSGNETRVLDLGTLSWRDGPPVPGGTQHGATVQVGDTFLLTGGHGNDYAIDEHIWEYDPSGEKWIERNETLAKTRTRHAAVGLPTCP